MLKYRIFIGSSTYGLPYAQAFFHIIEQKTTGNNATYECLIWNNLFTTSHTFLEVLSNLIGDQEEYDFGAFVLSPDDLISQRGKKGVAPRDNIVFESGLFVGKFGLKRTFLLKPKRVDLALPTDWNGLSYAEYSTSEARTEDNLRRGMQNAANDINRAVERIESTQGGNAKRFPPRSGPTVGTILTQVVNRPKKQIKETDIHAAYAINAISNEERDEMIRELKSDKSIPIEKSPRIDPTVKRPRIRKSE